MTKLHLRSDIAWLVILSLIHIYTLNKTQRVFAREFKGKRYDVGDKFGFMKTSIDYALKHPQVKEDLKAYIIELGKKLDQKSTQKNSD